MEIVSGHEVLSDPAGVVVVHALIQLVGAIREELTRQLQVAHCQEAAIDQCIDIN